MIRVIPFSVNSADYNMAADEYILSQTGTILRFYGWSSPTLSFGRYAVNMDEIDLDVCLKNGIQLVKRLTGGKTVLHQYELTYSIGSDIDCFSNSILETYRMISQPLSESLNRLGAETAISPRRLRDKKSSICFEEISAYEIAVKGKKMVGSAQYRKANRFLQHGSILMDIDWELWKQVWRLTQDSTILENRITTYRRETSKELDLTILISLFTENLALSLNQQCTVQDFTAEEQSRIAELKQNYRWNSGGFQKKFN